MGDFLVLDGIIQRLNQKFCHHEWKRKAEVILDDDRGRSNCGRVIGILHCEKCEKIILTVSHICS